MVVEGYQLEQSETKCPYMEDRLFTSKNLIINSIDSEGLEALLEGGYRHFGHYFYKPVCNGCNECQPIRVPVKNYNFSRSEKRVLSRGREFQCLYKTNPVPDRMKFELYLDHKTRFEGNVTESFGDWENSFYSNQFFNEILEIWDNEVLVAVTHLDVTEKIISAVYCYWNSTYASYSPGKLSVLKGIAKAIESGSEYYYLGYYIMDNKHMSYKINYTPNQILKDGVWQQTDE